MKTAVSFTQSLQIISCCWTYNQQRKITIRATYCYSERLKYLGWPTLNSRREFLSLVQLFKFINGFSRVDLCNYLTFSNSRTRSTNNVKIWTPYARTNILKNSFWYKYIKICNDLPSDIVVSSSSASKFKKKN